MDIGKCENPLKIKGHWKRKINPSDILPVPEEFVLNYRQFCNSIYAGMSVCLECLNKIKNFGDSTTACVDPFEIGDHTFSRLLTITLQIKDGFYKKRHKLTIGDKICNNCFYRLEKLHTDSTPCDNLSEVCCNPFNLHNDPCIVSLREVTDKMRLQFNCVVNLTVGDKICTKCNFQLYRRKREGEIEVQRGRSSARSACVLHSPLRKLASFSTQSLTSLELSEDLAALCGKSRNNIYSSNSSSSSEVASQDGSEINSNFPECFEDMQMDYDETLEDGYDYCFDPTTCANEFCLHKNKEILQIQKENIALDLENLNESLQSDTENECDSADDAVSDSEDDGICESEDVAYKPDADTSEVKQDAFRTIDACLKLFNISPVKNFRKSDLSSKYERVAVALKEKMEFASSRKISNKIECEQCQELINGAKLYFSKASTRMKYVILSSMPRSISKRKTAEIFGCGYKMVKRAFKLRSEFGPFSEPLVNEGRKMYIPESTRNLVDAFYKDPGNSRSLPGQRDTLMIKQPGNEKRVRVGKFQLLMTIQELYNEFCARFPDNRLSLTMFHLLRPRECIILGKNPYHRTCTCIIHENFDLLLNAIGALVNLKIVLDLVPCDSNSESCMMGECKKCPSENGINFLLNGLEGLEEVNYCQWEKTDGMEMKNITEPIEPFRNKFRNLLPKVLKHHFLVRQQNKFVNDWKLNHMQHSSEVMVTVDFAQNYNFFYQDEVQSLHWSHKQATIHPFNIQYTCPETGCLKSKDIVVISDDLQHNTVAFHAFQSKVIREIRKFAPHTTKIRYVSDGSAAQYKNWRNMINLLHHNLDFGYDATLEYFPTAHGKGPCDRTAAVVKRLVRVESLKRKKGSIQITSAYEMFEFLNTNAENENRMFAFVSKEDVRANYEKVLKIRFEKGSTIKGTQSFHSITPISRTECEGRNFTLQENPSYLSLDRFFSHEYRAGDFVIVKLENGWEVATIIDWNGKEIKLSIFKKLRSGKKLLLTLPKVPSTRSIHVDNIIGTIDTPVATTKSARAYTISFSDLKHIGGLGL